MNIKNSLLLFSFLLVAACTQLQAQVTYQVNMAASQISAFDDNGGTALIRYDLVGSPADSPFGLSFDVTVNFGNLTAVGATTPIKFGAPSLNVAQSRLLLDVDFTGVQLSDVQVGGPFTFNMAAEVSAMLAAGTLDVKYDYDLNISTPTANGWQLDTQSLGFFNNGFINHNLPAPASHSFVAGALDGATTFFTTLPVAINGTNDINLYLVGSGDPTKMVDFLDSVQRGGHLTFSNMTFSPIPVPEPGGAMLLGLAGGLLLLRRRRAA